MRQLPASAEDRPRCNRGGRLAIDEPTTLPDGTVLDLVGDDVIDDERARRIGVPIVGDGLRRKLTAYVPWQLPTASLPSRPLGFHD